VCPDNARSDDPTLASTASLLVATTNADKLREIRSLLTDLPIELVTLARWPDLPPPEETGRTFAENARLKARYYAAATGLLTVAEDSGLEIDALGGAPGVHSARFGGTHTSYAQKFALIYERLGASPPGGSSARFICALALAEGDAVLFESQGTVEGRIASEPKGEGGFGYDPIFFYPPFGCTLAEAGERKSAVSHRAAAFRALRVYLARS
jgi:non-canonical purine NTP pyrophosphatase, rdgB/HAM1 family